MLLHMCKKKEACHDLKGKPAKERKEEENAKLSRYMIQNASVS
jgi:hypothetical protein